LFRLLATAIIVVSMIVLSSCGTSGPALSKDKVNVVTSFYPLYDFAKQIGGEHANVVNLIPAGVEPHDWSPKSKDMSYISKSQLFFYNGAGFEGWVHDFIESLDPDSSLLSIEASKGIKLIEVDPDQAQEEHEDHGDHEEHLVDPHTWLSPLSAVQMATNIKDAFIKVDPKHKDDYINHYNALVQKLEQLHVKYEQALSKENIRSNKIIVSHQSFGYLCRDYGLEQIPFMGLAPDAEPTSKDIQKISEFVREHGVTTIFFEELVSDRLVKTLARDLKIKTEVLNPLEGLTEEQEKSGEDYLSIMEKNLQNLIQALK